MSVLKQFVFIHTLVHEHALHPHETCILQSPHTAYHSSQCLSITMISTVIQLQISCHEAAIFCIFSWVSILQIYISNYKYPFANDVNLALSGFWMIFCVNTIRTLWYFRHLYWSMKLLPKHTDICMDSQQCWIQSIIKVVDTKLYHFKLWMVQVHYISNISQFKSSTIGMSSMKINHTYFIYSQGIYTFQLVHLRMLCNVILTFGPCNVIY